MRYQHVIAVRARDTEEAREEVTAFLEHAGGHVFDAWRVYDCRPYKDPRAQRAVSRARQATQAATKRYLSKARAQGIDLSSPSAAEKLEALEWEQRYRLWRGFQNLVGEYNPDLYFYNITTWDATPPAQDTADGNGQDNESWYVVFVDGHA